MNIPNKFKPLVEDLAVYAFTFALVALLANAKTHVELNAMSDTERWCVTSVPESKVPDYLQAGYKLIPEEERQAHSLPKHSVARNRNRGLWDAGCPAVI